MAGIVCPIIEDTCLRICTRVSRKPVAQYESISIHCHESTEKAFLGCIEFVAVLLDIAPQSLVRGGRWVYVDV